MKIPYLKGDYVNVYKPAPDVYPGPDTERFRAGVRYEDWVPNDFTVVHDGKRWHMLGITHPRPEEFLSPESRFPNVHEAEWQLFHAVSGPAPLKQCLREGGFSQAPLVLSAPDRPGEEHRIHAPIVWKVGGRYVMLYGPDPFRLAVSEDLFQWKPAGEAFWTHAPNVSRDPNVMEKDGILYAIYTSDDGIYLRETRDMIRYSGERRLFRLRGAPMESPILKYIDGTYYLLYCIYDGNDQVYGYYDYRTYVYAAPSLEELDGAPCVAQLDAHAPELFQDEDGDWYIASAEWPYRGVSIAPLGWK